MIGLLRKWLGREDGVTAIEFTLVGVPFSLMVIGTIEMSLMFATQSLLDASTATAARLIRTGQIQQAGGNEEELFREAVCDYASVLIPCADIQFQVQNLVSFEDVEALPEAQFDEEGNLIGQDFSAGDENDVVLIRASYKYSIITPLMQPVLTNRSDGTRVMLSTMVFQTEPYEFEGEE